MLVFVALHNLITIIVLVKPNFVLIYLVLIYLVLVRLYVVRFRTSRR